MLAGGHCDSTSLTCVSDVAHWHLFTGLFIFNFSYLTRAYCSSDSKKVVCA